MRIAAFGNKIMVERLSRSLERQGFELVHLSETQQFVGQLRQKRCDLLLVDGLVKDADIVCRLITKLREVPVILMVDKKQADWGKLQSLDIHGYIPSGVRGTELAARLRAIARRCPPNGGAEKKRVIPASEPGQSASMGSITERKRKENLPEA